MILIFSAPSGSGKSTLVHHILSQRDDVCFSVSATTRKPRGKEVNGQDYYFLSQEDFKKAIATDLFVEYQEVYPGCFYGTLKREINRLESQGKNIIFDVDVVGGLNLKKIFGDQALSVFVAPPNLDVLRKRLVNRKTDSAEVIEIRLGKAADEMQYINQFDKVIINDDLEKSKETALSIVNEFLKG